MVIKAGKHTQTKSQEGRNTMTDLSHHSEIIQKYTDKN